MTPSSPVLRRSGFSARLVPLIIALGALPLMAPTCGDPGEGPKIFSKKTLIIPMDVCYQCTVETSSTGTVLTSPLNTQTSNCTKTGYKTPLASATNQNRYQGRACPQALDRGDVMKAYGLVYQLIRNKIAVYWIIQPNKTHLDDYDLTVQYASGFPVLLYDWASGGQGAAPTTAQSINYMGGAFVVDGADYDRASAVLQSLRGTFSDVNVHVSNLAFRGYAMKTMAGGWDAGGAVPPKLALLDIASGNLTTSYCPSGMPLCVSSPKNSEIVIQGYLERAGIGTGGAGGTATGTHGEIYDKLGMADFQPSTAGGPASTSRLFTNEYAILWIPHWVAPGSCSDISSATACFNSSPACTTGCSASRYTTVQVDQTLKTIGAFVGAGNDVFAECAGLGSLEGAFKQWNAADYTIDYKAGASDGSTRFQTQSGVRYNELPDANAAVPNLQLPPPLYIPQTDPIFATADLSSPLLQLGDFPFTPFTGAVEDYRPQNGTTYKPGTTRLVGAYPDPSGAGTTKPPAGTAPPESFHKWDYFTYRPSGTNPTPHGSIVYLGGHSYSGRDGTFQVAGSRLVLNTLFNLGASCTSSGISCNTGLHGVCAAGTYQCQAGQPVCIPTVQPGVLTEICNGVDDNCNGAVDEDLTTECYQAPAGYVDPRGRTGAAFTATQTVGECRPGVSSCGRNPDGSYGMSACVGQRLPAAESCNGLDDDCNGTPDEGLSRECYGGPAYSIDSNGNPRGECRAGTQTCGSGSWGAVVSTVFTPGACDGEVLPLPETCGSETGGGTALDLNCDGQLVTCGCTFGGPPRLCFSGPGTPGVGICAAGTQTCQSNGSWGPCVGEQVAFLSEPESCVSVATYVKDADINCDGNTTKCPDCEAGESQPCYGADPLAPLPPEAGRGVCAFGRRECAGGTWGVCQGYVLPSPIEYCDGKDNDCDGTVDLSAVCPTGSTCLRGVCVPSSCGTEVPPPEGYACSSGGSSGTVVAGDCGDVPTPGCAVGAVCQYGTCIDPCPVSATQLDPDTLQSVSLVCGKGTVCGGGACIGGGCYETGCGADQLCRSGACVANPCAGRTCPSGTFCRDGDCVQACTFVSCFAGQKCGLDGFCEPDPCAGRTCPPGQRCSAGVCALDPCVGKSCASGQTCVEQAGLGVCVDDPCTGITCPAGECSGGQCFATGNRTGAGTASQAPSAEDKGGCGCGSGSGIALPGLLALLAAPLARRRRRGAAVPPGALLLAVAALSLAAACKDPETKDQFDPRSCAETCGELRCVDLSTDPANCKVCGLTCSSGQQCAASECGPSSLVAPFISSISPGSGTKDAHVLVTLTGERFQRNATVRIATPLGKRTETCPEGGTGACKWVNGTLQVTVDLGGAPVAPGTPPWTFRVVNPDFVISNAVTFGVIVPLPTIAGVVPSSVLAGAVEVLTVSGTGFTSGSQCRLQGSVIGDIGLPSVLSGADLQCQLDATGIPPGTYQLTVMSEAGVRSNATTVTVTAADPVISSLDPNAGTSTVAIFVTGARFDSTSKVMFVRTPGAAKETGEALTTQYDDANHLFVPTFNLPVPPDNYSVYVRNGTSAFRWSNAVTFTVGTNPPAVTSVTPSFAYQGDPAVGLAFDGTNFPAGSVIEFQRPGGTTWIALTNTSSSSTRITATLNLKQATPGATIPEPEGTWQLRVRLGAAGSPSTPTWPLRVLSNQAILRNYSSTPSPSGSGRVGTTKTFAFEVANLHGEGSDFSAVEVWMEGPLGTTARTTHYLNPSPDPTAATAAFSVTHALTGLEAGLYALTVHNPNATASNALTFSVTPGPPTLASVCVKGTNCTKEARQSPTPVTLTLKGTNFAALDQNGNGSTVMVTAAFMWDPDLAPSFACSSSAGVAFQQVPGTVTVKSSTELEVLVDTTAAFAEPVTGTTYYLSVWNPSGSGEPLKSAGPSATCPAGTFVDPRTLPWFVVKP